MDIIKKIQHLYFSRIASKEAYAKFLGVHIGDNCLIGTKNWPSEPYLIYIGNNVQLTQDVYIHTHGGACRKT